VIAFHLVNWTFVGLCSWTDGCITSQLTDQTLVCDVECCYTVVNKVTCILVAFAGFNTVQQ